jgi:hypothetical protein
LLQAYGGKVTIVLTRGHHSDGRRSHVCRRPARRCDLETQFTLHGATGERLSELTCLTLPERENLPSLRFCRRSGTCSGLRRTSAKRSFTDPAMARSLARRCQKAKRPRLNLARRKKPIPVTPEPAQSLKNPANLEEQLSAREKSAAPLAISLAHAGTRCRPCSYEHRGLIKQRSARKKCRPARP